MTDIKDDGGPAYPRTAFDKDGELTTWSEEYLGMSLRDHFAGQAMLAVITGLGAMNALTMDMNRVIDGEDEDIAKAAYDMADAMIAARKK